MMPRTGIVGGRVVRDGKRGVLAGKEPVKDGAERKRGINFNNRGR